MGSNSSMFCLDQYSRQLLQLHDHICPRQILGLRMGELASSILELPFPQTNKRVLAFVESDGCFADGVMTATGCSMGHRTMRLVDEGKIAATFIDTVTERAFRIWPQPTVRQRAALCVPDKCSRWHAQLEAYQVMSVDELLSVHEVALTIDLRAIISRNGIRVACTHCGEEIINEREVIFDGHPLCRSCAGEGYFQFKAESVFAVSAIPSMTIYQ